MKTIRHVVRNVPQHWVGDGFPVRSLFSYQNGNVFDPFLLLDYAGPQEFAPSEATRGVGEHPHRGFETVTIVYQGELEHRDSSGSAGSIGPGDVQWMTAASGVVHEEYHSERFAREGGTLEMVQLWVNLPAKVKMSPPKYQSILSVDIPSVALPENAGMVRVIAGECLGVRGSAQTFSPINVWDIKLVGNANIKMGLPEGHTCVLLVQGESLYVNEMPIQTYDLVLFSQEGSLIHLVTTNPSRILILTGEPIGEPVFGQGPFVMSSKEEIRQAIQDYQSGLMGHLS